MRFVLSAECAVQVGKNRYPLSTKTVQWGLASCCRWVALHRSTGARTMVDSDRGGRAAISPAASLALRTLAVQGVELLHDRPPSWMEMVPDFQCLLD